MLNEINMEIIQVLSPLYAVPIMAVVFCAIIVYAFGFKSPVQPPSFEGIDEEKKFVKKKKSKETQKISKLLQNGKVNGHPAPKINTVTSEKKESDGKAYNLEKSSKEKTPIDKKVSKKTKTQHEKVVAQEKKKENITHDEANNDGWVQLLSKKGKKNKKKEDSVIDRVTPTSITELIKATSVQVEEQPKRIAQPDIDKLSLSQKQAASINKEKTSKCQISSPDVPKLPIVSDFSNLDTNNIEKQPPKESPVKGAKVMEESGKSKKKKKKSSELMKMENELVHSTSNTTSESSAVQVISEAPTSEDTSKNLFTPELLQKSKKLEPAQVSEVELSGAKISNVAFDELAGLYPETKEQKKKKKVRRDH